MLKAAANAFEAWWIGKAIRDIAKTRQESGLEQDTAFAVSQVQLSRLVVVGSESNGKTSTLNRLVGMDLLETGKDIVTVRPYVIKLVYHETRTDMILQVPKFKNASLFVTTWNGLPPQAGVPECPNPLPMDPDALPNEHPNCAEASCPDCTENCATDAQYETLESKDPMEIREAIRRDFDNIRKSGEGISTDEAILTVYGKTMLNIELVDLPGLLIVTQTNEPSALPNLVKDLVLKYITQPNCIVLGIFDCNAPERQCPCADLLKHHKPSTLIQVFTKADRAFVYNAKKGKQMDVFMGRMKKKGLIKADYIVGLKNVIHDEETASFDQILADEKEFFKLALTEDERKQCDGKLGIEALNDIISKCTETSSRSLWKTELIKKYEKEIADVAYKLNNLGPLLTVDELARAVIFREGGLKNPDSLLMAHCFRPAWDKCQFQVPVSNVPTARILPLDIRMFFENAKAHFISFVLLAFEDANLTLHRYEEFKEQLKCFLTIQFESNETNFMDRWDVLQKAITIQWQISPCHYQSLENCLYDPNMWFTAACSAIVQTVLLTMVKGDTNDLRLHMVGAFRDFSNAECSTVAALRVDYEKKIAALRSILKIL